MGRPIRIAILALVNLIAAILSDWSWVFVEMALFLAALAIYSWARPLG